MFKKILRTSFTIFCMAISTLSWAINEYQTDETSSVWARVRQSTVLLNDIAECCPRHIKERYSQWTVGQFAQNLAGFGYNENLYPGHMMKKLDEDFWVEKEAIIPFSLRNGKVIWWEDSGVTRPNSQEVHEVLEPLGPLSAVIHIISAGGLPEDLKDNGLENVYEIAKVHLVRRLTHMLLYENESLSDAMKRDMMESNLSSFTEVVTKGPSRTSINVDHLPNLVNKLSMLCSSNIRNIWVDLAIVW